MGQGRVKGDLKETLRMEVGRGGLSPKRTVHDTRRMRGPRPQLVCACFFFLLSSQDQVGPAGPVTRIVPRTPDDLFVIGQDSL